MGVADNDAVPDDDDVAEPDGVRVLEAVRLAEGDAVAEGVALVEGVMLLDGVPVPEGVPDLNSHLAKIRANGPRWKIRSTPNERLITHSKGRSSHSMSKPR